ncbi:hypothetical protein ASPACDRAFT_46421 [Aspergillus aculeatus ATCC 16872]|uniref:6,7-dimethyl-8-ribityllumazine synthase n=1 Tax=Aspergillus aculeatus (strain ATCC 16872 / CBS 172.66 / WB 5094) TaxID=690307 RepID=A0A1L9WL57_ASPA1|nr:uncharacterized protein ASPACDRAFT_46421 [Aspergillus aculeatus ATCC 16872]OJJ96893.1 hypothetical protein ASPACDRAFT_46421 [Aspergillus aculeatus ATCC 16872]
MVSSIKDPDAVKSYNGASLRIAIVHARWNNRLIESLITGAKSQLLEAGVKEEDIVLESVPGSYELPFAVQRIIHTSQTSRDNIAFDAVIAIGALIKGETMHFEYISEAVSQGLMRVQLDTHVPVIFGLLTLLTEQQGLERAGLAGEHWGRAAVELGVKNREDWVAGGCRSALG